MKPLQVHCVILSKIICVVLTICVVGAVCRCPWLWSPKRTFCRQCDDQWRYWSHYDIRGWCISSVNGVEVSDAGSINGDKFMNYIYPSEQLSCNWEVSHIYFRCNYNSINFQFISSRYNSRFHITNVLSFSNNIFPSIWA